jgi:hypothetical protein
MKTGPDSLGTAENEFGRAKHETGLDFHGTDKNESGIAKHEKQDPTPSVPPKTSMAAQCMKMGPDAPRTAENESWRAE